MSRPGWPVHAYVRDAQMVSHRSKLHRSPMSPAARCATIVLAIPNSHRLPLQSYAPVPPSGRARGACQPKPPYEGERGDMGRARWDPLKCQVATRSQAGTQQAEAGWFSAGSQANPATVGPCVYVGISQYRPHTFCPLHKSPALNLSELQLRTIYGEALG